MKQTFDLYQAIDSVNKDKSFCMELQLGRSEHDSEIKINKIYIIYNI